MAKMGSSAADALLPPPPSSPYFASPTSPPPLQNPNPPAYILLPSFPGRRRRRPRCCGYSSYLLASAAILCLLALSLFLIWPTDPNLRVVRLRIDHIRVSTDPTIAVSIVLRLRIRVRNPNYFSLNYEDLSVGIGYRGELLGSIVSAGGRLRARGVSYADAELRIDGIEVIHDVFYLIKDLATGTIPFDTVTEVKGMLHFFFFDIPIKGRVSCSVNVNLANESIIRQDCYTEASRNNS